MYILLFPVIPVPPVPPWLIQPEYSNRRRYRWPIFALKTIHAPHNQLLSLVIFFANAIELNRLCNFAESPPELLR
jgi:hypothetical protein